MRRSSKTILTTLLCGAMIASAASCATSQTYPLTVDGEKIRAGIYILEQSSAIDQAKNKLSEEQPDLDTTAKGFSYLDQTVEGKKFSEWVDDKTTEFCCNYMAINRLFNQYGLELTKEETDEVYSYVKRLWTEENQYAVYIYGVKIPGEYFEKIGIGEESYREMQLLSSKREKIFDYLYGENGIKAATTEEINAKLSTDYVMVNYFEYTLQNGEGAQAYADRIKNGESYEQVYRDYTVAVAAEEKAKSDAEEAAKAAEGVTEENAAGSGEDTSAAAQETPVPETDSLIQTLAKDASAPYSDLFKLVYDEMNVGDVKVLTVEEGETTHTYVVQKFDILSKPDHTTDRVKTIRSDLKQDEFDELIASTGKSFTVTEDSSKGMYKIQTILDTKKGIYG